MQGCLANARRMKMGSGQDRGEFGFLQRTSLKSGLSANSLKEPKMENGGAGTSSPNLRSRAVHVQSWRIKVRRGLTQGENKT